MKPEELVAFFSQRGVDVVRTASCWWYEEQRGSRLYSSFPTHRLINPSAIEISDVFDGLPKALAVRFVTPAVPGRKESFMWVRRAPYDLNVVLAKSRNQIRRGLEACEVRTLSWHELIETAREAHKDTMTRHGVREDNSLGFDVGLAQCHAYEAWGAFIRGRLAAYAVTVTVEDWVHILLHRSGTADLKARPNNALIFSLVSEALARPNVSTVSYGIEPLAALESLDHFKVGMGFLKESIGQRIVVAPRFRLFINSVTAKPIQALAGLVPNSARLRKIAGFCRVASYS